MTNHFPDSGSSLHPTLTVHWNTIPSSPKGFCVEENPDAKWCSGIGISDLHAEKRTLGCNINQITEALQSSTIFCGDSLTVLQSLPNDFFYCCITSPPYWDTRLSGYSDRLGCEEDFRDYIQKLVRVFQEVKRTLKPCGTFWLIIGDTYAGDCNTWWSMCTAKPEKGKTPQRKTPEGFKPKDLMGIPWRVAMALQEEGWYLRSDIVWSIPNIRLEPVGDRPARGHDYVFLFTKSEDYTYNGHSREASLHRTVWEIPACHKTPIDYSVFPELLAERCMRAGSSKGDVVLDPFFGSGTVGIVAKRLFRRYVGIDICPDYVSLATKRIKETKVSG